MYKKADPTQIYLDDFKTQFYGKLRKDNRWIKIAELMPWVEIEERYAKNFTEKTGVEAINARIAFGALFIKENENLTDESTVMYIMENPYMQYFLGLSEFTEKPLFDASMMTHFRKRFPADIINQLNKMVFEPEAEKRILEEKEDDNNRPPTDNAPPTEPPSGEGSDIQNQGQEPTFFNKGELILDATAAPADIRYPNDLSLLNESRENLEQMIDELWKYGDRKGHKTAYNRRKARNGYLAIAKQKKPRRAKMRNEISLQLSYIKRNLDAVTALLLEAGKYALPARKMMRLSTIKKVYEQQQKMHDEKINRCDDRIVSLRQPHIRTIIRGKSGRQYEFGQKIDVSVINGYTFINRQRYDNFNEGITLIKGVEAYKARYGYYPKAVLADKIYRNRENLSYCKKHGIRLSGPRLGRPKINPSKADKLEMVQDNKKRNMVEGKF